MNVEEDLKIYEIEENQKLSKYEAEYTLALDNLKKVTLYNSAEQDMNLLGGLLIDLPYKPYLAMIGTLSISDDILEVNKKIKLIEDNAQKEIGEKIDQATGKPLYSNQDQRASAIRLELFGNNIYQILQKQYNIRTKHKTILLAQKEYYDSVFSGVKIRYRQMCQVVLNDRELEKL